MSVKPVQFGRSNVFKPIQKVANGIVENTKGVDNPIKVGAAIATAALASALPSYMQYNKVNYDYFKLPKVASPDKYQIDAARYLQRGESVLVSAPTGTGKTAIAQYVISKNMAEGKKTYYTTPLKALSNQKLLEFREIYGEENVGILTGDRKENPNAPILIMTTEVYRNMVFDDYFNESQKVPSNLKTVIFDEFHYLGDESRGRSWEESIIFTPHKIQLLALSATIGNDKLVAQWLDKLQNKKTNLVHVPPENRHVPLEYTEYDAIRYKFKEYGEKSDADSCNDKRFESKKKTHSKKVKKEKIKEKALPYSSDYMHLVDKLHKEKKTPAIFFVFSKNYSNTLLEDCVVDNWSDLNTEREKHQIDDIMGRYKKKYGYIGCDLNTDALKKGYAVHNAGILPVQKELIEELFNKKLVKVVFATETLAAGINMPARTVVVSSATKPSSSANAANHRRVLTPNEYHQMTGRAGRRGIDERGYVVNLTVNSESAENFADLVSSDPNPIFSGFTPNYSLITSYHQYNQDTEKIDKVFHDSFRAFLAKEKRTDKVVKSMHENYESKCKLLEDAGYLENGGNNTRYLTQKGKLLHNIVGFQQIPLVDLITSNTLGNLTPEELVFLAASVVSGEYNKDEKQSVFCGSPVGTIKDNMMLAKIHKFPNIDFSNLERITSKYNSLNSKYNERLERYEVTDEKIEVPDYKFASQIYLFALMNSQKPNQSLKNWDSLLNTFSDREIIRDEGTLYNSVNQTVDLLNQMYDLCNDALKIENNESGKYYETLATNLQKSISLLKQEPIQDYQK